MKKNSFNGLFAGPGKVVLLEDEEAMPRVSLPEDEVCTVCGESKTVLELIDGVCFDPCRYRAYLQKEKA